MKISTRSRYGLRAMIYIADRHRPTSGEAVAGHEEISKKYLDTILKRLREAGLLKSLRGPGGGYTLARPPEDIRVADVVNVLEDGLAVTSCVEKPWFCGKTETCPAHHVWKALSEAFEEALSGITLADLIRWRPGADPAGMKRVKQEGK